MFFVYYEMVLQIEQTRVVVLELFVFLLVVLLFFVCSVEMMTMTLKFVPFDSVVGG